MCDSIGNLASRKEGEDALKSDAQPADFTRAKALKSLFRIITPHLTLKDIPMIVINHIYMTMTKFSTAVVSGGTGIYLSSDAVWIIGRQQEKDGDDHIGYNFTITIDKSRHVKEKSKLDITITFDGGMHKWSGLFEHAKDIGFIKMGKPGWYTVVDPETGAFGEVAKRKKELETDDDLWEAMLASKIFKKSLIDKYKLSTGDMIKTTLAQEEGLEPGED